MAVAAFLALLSACSTTRVVRLDTGQAQPIIHIPRSDDAEPVELEQEEFLQAVAQQARHVKPSANPELSARGLFDISARAGWYGYTQREGIIPLEGSPPPAQWAPIDVRVTREYMRFCEAIGKAGDCRKVLVNSPVLTGDGRYALGMSFAIEEIVPEMMQSFRDMADPEAIKASLYWTMTLYAAMWLLPEPFSKGLAAVLTASFIAYVGVDTFWSLIVGWRRLVEAVDHATSFAEIREAGKKYGRVMGKNAARAFALLVTAAIGQTASGFSSSVPMLPGSAQASVVGGAQVGIRLAQVGQVEAVAVSADAITIALAPNAVAATAQGLSGAASGSADLEGPRHHIATDKWPDATHSGGPWTPKFEELFDRAGMSLDDPANTVRVRGHVGPHPQEYHEEVYRRLREAMQGCRSISLCQGALKTALQELAEEISTEGTRLNKLVTRTE